MPSSVLWSGSLRDVCDMAEKAKCSHALTWEHFAARALKSCAQPTKKSR